MDGVFSSKNEAYVDHVKNCRQVFEALFPIFKYSAIRLLDAPSERIVENSLRSMIIYHDLGKLTKLWQQKLIQNASYLPRHAPIGASLLFKILPDNLKEPVSLAVCVHHTDSGVLGTNLESPDAQAIVDGIVDQDGRIIWSDLAFELDEFLFPEEARSLNVEDLKEMALSVRTWARGSDLLTNQKRRIQALFCHHLLKLCDIYSASSRIDFSGVVKSIMVDEIVDFVSGKLNFDPVEIEKSRKFSEGGSGC